MFSDEGAAERAAHGGDGVRVSTRTNRIRHHAREVGRPPDKAEQRQRDRLLGEGAIPKSSRGIGR